MYESGGTSSPNEQQQDDGMIASDMTTTTQADRDTQTGRRIRVTAVLFCVIVWAGVMYYAFG